jgi:hypothetical protein
MGVRNILAQVGTIVDAVAGDVKSDVTYEAFLSEDAAGTVALAGPVTVKAYVSRTKKQVLADSGGVAMIDAKLTFTTPMSDVDPRAKFTLSDGTSSPIVKVGGFIDPVTLQPFVTTVTLGRVMRGTNEVSG